MSDPAGVRPPLALLIVEANPERLRAALLLARCELALGGSARLFLQGGAVVMLRPPIESPQDGAWQAAGEPALGALLLEALEDGVAIAACQSGLAMAALSAQSLDPRITIGGMIGALAAVPPEARLVMV